MIVSSVSFKKTTPKLEVKKLIKSKLQTKPFTCGPLSILNALNHLGVDNSFDEDSLSEISNARPEIGTDNNDLISAIKMIGGVSIFNLKENSCLTDLESEISKGRVCIINYFNAFSNVGHFATVVGFDDTGFYLLDSVLGDLRLKKQSLEKFWHNSDGTVRGWFVSLGTE